MRLPIRLVILPLLLAASAPGLQAQGYQRTGTELVEWMLEQSDSVLQERRFVGRAPVVDGLAEGTSRRSSFAVSAGRDYVIVAACDENCGLPRLTVTSSAGQRGDGRADGDFSVLSFRSTAAAVYRIEVGPDDCDITRCAVGHQVFERSSTEDRPVCVIENGRVTEIAAQYDPEEGETTIGGRPLDEVHPSSTPTYAAEADWFVQNEAITLEGRRYRKYGLPRVLGVDQVVRSGDYRGTPLFSEEGNAETVWAPVRTGCEFQPYRRAAPGDGGR